jgi:hypothetical protein
MDCLAAGPIQPRLCRQPSSVPCSFGSALSEEESDDLYECWAIPAPDRPLLEASAASFTAVRGDWHAEAEGPGLRGGGELNPGIIKPGTGFPFYNN